MPTSKDPVLVALVNDYDVLVIGIAHLLEPYRDRVVVAELDARRPVEDDVDVVLYDTFAQPEADQAELEHLVRNPHAGRVAVYTWNFHDDLIREARRLGASGYLSKALPARDLVAAIEAVHAGEVVISDPPRKARSVSGLDWPGRAEGLSDRESEILALITQGKSNAEIVGLTHLSPNTVKSYIRNLYRKIDASSRTQAMLWGMRHGFDPDHDRIEHWKGGP
jgi:DNA-binding NarL/FixJ family response regulator